MYTLVWLGEAQFGLGKENDAHWCFSKAASLLQIHNVSSDYDIFSSALIKLSILYYRKRDFNASISSLQQCINFAQRCLDDDYLHREIASLFEKIATIYFITHDYDEALKCLRKVVLNQRSYLLKDDAYVASTLQRMAVISLLKNMNYKSIDYPELYDILMENLKDAYYEIGDLDGAVTFLSDDVSSKSKLNKSNHASLEISKPDEKKLVIFRPEFRLQDVF